MNDKAPSTFSAPKIDPLGSSEGRPQWSVMIPTFNPGIHLKKAVESIVSQVAIREDVQIEIVDNCSENLDLNSLLGNIGAGKVLFHRNAKNIGMNENWNECIRRAKGHLVHILHEDDYVAPGFYSEIERLASEHPKCSFYATRNFFVDAEDIISGVSARNIFLENETSSANFLLEKPYFQCPSVVVRRSFYEQHGGFLLNLKYSLDWEMWARAIYYGRGIQSNKVLAYYRVHSKNESHRISETGEGARDLLRLANIFTQYEEFDPTALKKRASKKAFSAYCRHVLNGNKSAAKDNRKVFMDSASKTQILVSYLRLLSRYIRRHLNRNGQP